MKSLKATILLLLFGVQSYAQDGSDTRYYKTFAVDSSLVGQYIHLDFYNRSFASSKTDTVTITIDDKPIRFEEVRKDDGFNNWFSQQFLQSVGKVNNQTIRISKFKLDSVKPTSFVVTMYVDFFDGNNNLLNNESRRLQYQFDKRIIVEVLVKSKQL
jgi:hypothetical protein